MADEASETVEGTIKSVVFHNDENGYTVLHVELPSGFALRQLNEITVVGKAQAVWEGEEISATGSWVTDKVHGRQFKAESIVCVAPRSLVGIERYLASGLIKGVGKVLAKRIVETFGEDTLHVLSHQSARLVEVPKLGKAKIEQIRASWHANETLRENMIFGQTYGISIAKMTKIVRKYGPDAIAIVKADPYKLCRDIWGIGFATADHIALSVGIPKDSPLRARASISYTLETEAEDSGHCWTFENDLLLHANELTEIPTEILGEALEKEIAEGRVIAESEAAPASQPIPLPASQPKHSNTQTLKHLPPPHLPALALVDRARDGLACPANKGLPSWLHARRRWQGRRMVGEKGGLLARRAANERAREMPPQQVLHHHRRTGRWQDDDNPRTRRHLRRKET